MGILFKYLPRHLFSQAHLDILDTGRATAKGGLVRFIIVFLFSSNGIECGALSKDDKELSIECDSLCIIDPSG